MTGDAPDASSMSARCNLAVGSTPLIVRTTLSTMSMGTRKRHAKQVSMWVATEDLPRSAAHPLYTRLNQILDAHDFDEYVEGRCARSTRTKVGQGCRRADISACC